MKKRLLHHPCPKEILILIGDITVSFALLEVQMQMIAKALLGCSSDRKSQIVLAVMSMKNLRTLLAGLGAEAFKDDGLIKELRSLLRRSEKVEKQRNDITHSFWAGGSEVTSRLKWRATEANGLKFEIQKMSTDSLKEIAEEIKSLASDYFEFLFFISTRTRLHPKK